MDTFSRVWELLAKIWDQLPEQKELRVGGFVYQAIDDRKSLGFDFRRTGGNWTRIAFFPGAVGTFPTLLFLRIEVDDWLWSLLPNAIEQERMDTSPLPHFEYVWMGGNVRLKDKGKLDFVRVDLTDDSFISWYPRTNLEAIRRGKSPLLKKVPVSLKGQQEILGPIPWQIDYDERAGWILAQSGLDEFVQSIQALKPARAR